MIYIASPFFNPQQLEAVRVIENILKRTDFKFFSPRLHGVNVSTLSEEERKSGSVMADVFKGNIDALDNSNLLLACIDDKDQGTNFELGYFYRESMFGGGRDALPFDGAETIRNRRLRNPNIITWSARGSRTNLMISQAVVGHCATLADMETYFKHVRSVVEHQELARDTWTEINLAYDRAYNGFARADVAE